MLNLLKDNKGARKKFKSLGRGIGSGKGKTCGRGSKGQTARSGVAINGFEGGQMPLCRRVPKRGFNSLNKIYYQAINFIDVEKLIDSKKLDPASIKIDDLRKVGLLKGYNKKVKLLGSGMLRTAFNIEVHAISLAAEKVIKKIGGSVALV